MLPLTSSCLSRSSKALVKASVSDKFNLNQKGFSFVKNLLTTTPYHIVATSRSRATFEESCKLANFDATLKSRITFLPLDVTSELSIQAAAKNVSEKFGQKSLRCLINSAGYLLPEKSIRNVDFKQAEHHFQVNTIGPMLMAKHFSGLLANPEKSPSLASGPLTKSVWVNISARTGSIGDNHLGGWYSYRMSKAALNQLTKTLAIELGRKGTLVVSLHPGTVVGLTHIRLPSRILIFQENIRKTWRRTRNCPQTRP